MRLSHQQNLNVGYKEAINQSKNIKVIFVFFMQSILFQESEGKCNVKLSIVSFILLRIFFNALGISWPCFFFVWFFFLFCLFVCVVCCFFSSSIFQAFQKSVKTYKKNFYFQKIWHFFMKYISHFKLSITFFDSIFPVNFFAHHARLLKYKSDASWWCQ